MHPGTPSMNVFEMQIHWSVMLYYCIWISQAFPQGYQQAFTGRTISCLLGGSFSMLWTHCVYHHPPPTPFLNHHLEKLGIFTRFFSTSWTCWMERLGMVRPRVLGECLFEELTMMKADWAKWWPVGALLNLTWSCRYTAACWQSPEISLGSPAKKAEEGVHIGTIIHHYASHFSQQEVTPWTAISQVYHGLTTRDGFSSLEPSCFFLTIPVLFIKSF